jgi:hypothetical protein
VYLGIYLNLIMGMKNCSLRLRKGYKLMVIKNRVLSA